MCLRGGRAPKRKVICRNVGMHSHPECLNKLPVKEAVNTRQRKTTITRPHRRRPPWEKHEIETWSHTHGHYLQREKFFVHAHTHKQHPDVWIRRDPQLLGLVCSQPTQTSAPLNTRFTRVSCYHGNQEHQGPISAVLIETKDALTAELNYAGNYKLPFSKIEVTIWHSFITPIWRCNCNGRNNPASKMEVYEESIRQGLIVIAVWFQLMLVIFHDV